MKKVNKKKGFTLAELLVVIAILAILVAVAVPIFTGVVSDAQDKVNDANVRAVRAAAVTKILTDETTGDANLMKGATKWTATATVSDTGVISDLEISKTVADDAVEGLNSDGKVVAIISSLDNKSKKP